MPLSYWGEASSSITYLINRVSSTTIHFKTPFQNHTEAIIVSTISNLAPHVFGCMLFVCLHKHQCTKLNHQALHRAFIGYATYQNGYKCYHPPSHRLFVTIDVVFHEYTLYFSKPKFQEDYQMEIQTLDYDEIDAQNMSNLDINGITLVYTINSSHIELNQKNE